MLVTDIDLPALRRSLRGPLVTPEDPAWDSARQAWNLAVDQRPEAVAFAAGVDDVVAVVDFARTRGLQVAVQGTGHGAASLGPLDATILVKTTRLGAVVIDTPWRRAKVQAGALWGDVAVAAGQVGLAALHGSSPDVGVVGYTLGGGVGWLGRRYGLACNSVTAIQLVTADGRARRVDAERDPELFWALRGGGGAFGVVTAIEFELYPLAEVYAGMLAWPAELGSELLHAYREWSAALPGELTSIFRFLHLPPIPEVPEPLRGRRVVTLGAACTGGATEGAALLRPMRAIADPLMDTFAPTAAAELVHLHGDPEQPTPGISHHALLRELDAATADAFVAAAGPGSGSPLVSAELRHLGGALASAPEAAGALARMDGTYLMCGVGVPASPSDACVIDAHLDELVAAVQPASSGREYLNFAERRSPASAAFDAATLTRLAGVKRRVDPDGLFRSNHPLQPEA
jgi:FAD/FMN-containing dehydrogenase